MAEQPKIQDEKNARDIDNRFKIAAGNTSSWLFGDQVAKVLNKIYRDNGASGDVFDLAGLGSSTDPNKVVFSAKLKPGQEEQFRDITKKIGGESFEDSESKSFDRDMRIDAGVMRNLIGESYHAIPADKAPVGAKKGLAAPKF